MAETLTLRQAQLATLATQGLIGDRAQSVIDVIGRTDIIQIDSVNVFERAHYLPIFSRLGVYQKSSLDSLTGGFNPTLLEYWAHAASYITSEDFPLYRYRMDEYRKKYLESKGSWGYENRKFIEWLCAEVADKGPVTAGEIEHDRSKRGSSWWGWSDVKRGLELLILSGDLIAAGRRNFQRLYAAPSTVLPQALLRSQIDKNNAQQQLLLKAANSFGVATAADLIDYHRLKMVPNQKTSEHQQLLNDLVSHGQLVKVQISGQAETYFAVPEFLESANWSLLERQSNDLITILSPFDPLAWNRDRANRLYGFDYKIEIYTPEAKRQFGYYCLPILFEGALAGRIDLKSDRKTKRLLVQAAWHERHLSSEKVAKLSSKLARHLKLVATWQDLQDIRVRNAGNLAEALELELKV